MIHPGSSRMGRSAHRLMRILSLALAVVLASGFQQQTFNTAVDLVAVDVTVVDKDGKPIGDLKAEDFEVWISQRPRKVVTIDRRDLWGGGSSASRRADAPAPTGLRRPRRARAACSSSPSTSTACRLEAPWRR